MKLVWKLVLLVSLWTIVQSSPFDDGKYKPKVYEEYDDGKYYRPLTEGKYVPGDEGKYMYIYQQGVYPYDGTYKHLERGDSNDYIGFQIYAPRFPYIHRIIKELISKYVSPDILVFSEAESGNVNNFDQAQTPEQVAMKCNLIDPETKNSTETEIVTQYPPLMKLEEGENAGTLYSFKGTKLLSKVENSLKTKLKLQYEVFVRVVEETELAILLVTVISSAIAGDDGKYHPEVYGNEGKYRPNHDHRYYDYLQRYNNYYGKNVYNPTYNPLYYNSIRPHQELVAPFGKSDFPQVVVTARPPIVTSTALPFVPSTVKYQPLYASNQYLNGRNARIITQDSDTNANGYHYTFQTENGIVAEETGNVASASNDGNKVRGFYEYVGDNGLTYRVDYTADENGFHPTGAHLP